MFGVTFSTDVTMYIVFRVLNAAFGYGTTIGSYVYSGCTFPVLF